MKDFIIYAFVFILGFRFGSLLMGEKAYNLGLKVGKRVRYLIKKYMIDWLKEIIKNLEE